MTPPAGVRRVVLARHGSVAETCRGVCYGASDVPLSELGRLESRQLAAQLGDWPITHLFHSGLARSRQCAEMIAQARHLPAVAAPALAELNFGEWELQTWDVIYAAMPSALDRLLAEPGSFAAPRGETLFAMRDRVLAWYRSLPATGLIVAIGHGGPIAALRGTLAGIGAAQWPKLIPRHAEIVEVP